MKRIIKILLILFLLFIICLVGIKIYVKHNVNQFQIPVLMYHDVVLDDYYEGADDTISVRAFMEQLQYFKDNNYKTLTLDEFYDYVKSNKKVPKKSVLLTFDDGFYSFHYIVEQLLEQYDMHAVCFIIGDATNDETKPYNPKEYGTIGKDLINNHSKNVSYASHSYGLHKMVNGKKRVETLSVKELEEDVLKQKEIYDFKYISYPFNTDTKELIKVLKDNGYKLAFRGEQEMASRKVNLYQIPRIGAKQDYNEFKKIMASDYYKNRYGYGLFRKIMITIERKLGKRLF